MRLFQTLRTRLLLGSFLLLLVLFGIYSYFSVRFYTDQMMTQVLEDVNRLSDFIKSSTHHSMLLNRKEDVYQIINTIGQQAGVEGIRMYNKRGEITFSTDKREQRTVVNMQAEACYGCHDQAKPLDSVPVGGRMRIYKAPDGHRVLGLINPIRNEQQCSNAGCHSHPTERTVLGVLDVRMSLEKVDEGMAKAQGQFVFVAILTVAMFSVASLIFLSVTVLRPVGKLMRGTQEIARGNLDYQISVNSKDEMGRLARSFNEMMQSLRRAEEENRQWAQTLEQRVQQKTNELKRIHEHIVQVEKMASLGKLSATVAHEINNPLEGILTYAKLISRRIKKNNNLTDEQKETLEDIELIRRETERCGTIVKNLLLFSKKQVGEFALVPVNQIVQKAAQLMKHHFDISNVQFSAECSAGEPLLLCDENQIQQALVALFVNAVEAMPGGGTLNVGVRQTTEEITITVGDTGIGIPKDDIPHVFEPFFTTKENGQGVGLGLSVVYGIVERQGGKISVDSKLSKGTKFTLVFPQSSQSTAGKSLRTA